MQWFEDISISPAHLAYPRRVIVRVGSGLSKLESIFTPFGMIVNLTVDALLSKWDTVQEIVRCLSNLDFIHCGNA